MTGLASLKLDIYREKKQSTLFLLFYYLITFL